MGNWLNKAILFCRSAGGGRGSLHGGFRCSGAMLQCNESHESHTLIKVIQKMALSAGVCGSNSDGEDVCILCLTLSTYLVI